MSKFFLLFEQKLLILNAIKSRCKIITLFLVLYRAFFELYIVHNQKIIFP